MTLSEFKAWFEGYTEGLEAAPTKAQFDRIKEKVKLIDGAPIVQTVWRDYYLRQYPMWGLPYNGLPPMQAYYAAAQGVGVGAVGQMKTVEHSFSNQLSADGNPGFGQSFDSHSAMYELGKAEAIN